MTKKNYLKYSRVIDNEIKTFRAEFNGVGKLSAEVGTDGTGGDSQHSYFGLTAPITEGFQGFQTWCTWETDEYGKRVCTKIEVAFDGAIEARQIADAFNWMASVLRGTPNSFIQGELLTPKEAQSLLLRKTRQSIYKWIRSGELKALTVNGRYYIPQAEMDRLISEKAIHTGEQNGRN